MNDDTLTKEFINEVFGNEVLLPSATDEVSYHYKLEGDYLLVYKQFQNTISIFEDTNEFVCVLRDYGVKTKNKLLKVLQSSSLNIIPKGFIPSTTIYRGIIDFLSDPNIIPEECDVEYLEEFVRYTLKNGSTIHVPWYIHSICAPHIKKEDVL